MAIHYLKTADKTAAKGRRHQRNGHEYSERH